MHTILQYLQCNFGMTYRARHSCMKYRNSMLINEMAHILSLKSFKAKQSLVVCSILELSFHMSTAFMSPQTTSNYLLQMQTCATHQKHILHISNRITIENPVTFYLALMALRQYLNRITIVLSLIPCTCDEQ